MWSLAKGQTFVPRNARFIYPLGVHVATSMGCLKAVANARSSIALAASQASELLYSAVATATFPPENIRSVKI